MDALQKAREHSERLAQAEAAVRESETELRQAEDRARLHRIETQRRAVARGRKLAVEARRGDAAGLTEAKAAFEERQGDEARQAGLDAVLLGLRSELEERREALAAVAKDSPKLFALAVRQRAEQLGAEYAEAVARVEELFGKLMALDELRRWCWPHSMTFCHLSAQRTLLPSFGLQSIHDAAPQRAERPHGLFCAADVGARWGELLAAETAAFAEQGIHLRAAPPRPEQPLGQPGLATHHPVGPDALRVLAEAPQPNAA
ncbi:MAG: hypothetical protein AB1578_18145 [Thermodesulfobacteriota bacterium]